MLRDLHVQVLLFLDQAGSLVLETRREASLILESTRPLVPLPLPHSLSPDYPESGISSSVHTNSSAHTTNANVVTKLNIGCLNVRGASANAQYINLLLKRLHIFAISEHWLHSYELNSMNTNFKFLYVSSSTEDSMYCRPRYLRGHGGVSIAWHKSLSNSVSKIVLPNTRRIVGIKLLSEPRPICFFSVYLPTRSGCTDVFKESLDYIDAELWF